MTTNPCFSCPGMPPKKTKCKIGNCICFCDVYISPKDSLAVPCNTRGNLELDTYDKDISVCMGNTAKYALMYFDGSFFTDVTLTDDGALTWVPAGGVSQHTGNIIFKLYCGELAKLVTVTIGRKNLCSSVHCPDGMVCDPCTGLCKPINCGPDTDLTLTQGAVNITNKSGDVDLTIVSK